MRFYNEEDVRDFKLKELRYVKTGLSGFVFTITLSRPEKRNAFNPQMAAEIAFALAYAQYNVLIRCVVLKAEGPVFCAGADLTAFEEAGVVTNIPQSREPVRLGDAFADLHKPSIAQVEGPVFAGGFLLICGCTFVVSTPEATFSLPEVKRGIWPMQVMASLRRIMSARKVLEMSTTGKVYNAKEALKLGLVTNIADSQRIEGEVQNMAKSICMNAPLAIQKGIEASNAIDEIPVSEQHAFLQNALNKLLETEDAKEGAAAFREKRNPVWKNK